MWVTIFAYLVTFIIVFFPINTLFIGLCWRYIGPGSWHVNGRLAWELYCCGI